MKLKNIRISNFRSIQNLEVSIKNFTTLIGPNNAGKSTVLRALQLFLDQEKPDLNEWPVNNPNSDIEIEVLFDELQEWERDKPGVAGIVFNNKIHLKYVAKVEAGKVSIDYLAFKADETITGWSDSWNNLDERIKEIAGRIQITTAQAWRNSANKERVRAQIRDLRPDLITIGEPTWSGESISIKSALQQAIPQVIYIPAITDTDEVSKPAAKNAFGKLISKIVIPAIQRSQEYVRVTESLNSLKARLSDENHALDEIRDVVTDMTQRLSAVFTARVLLTMEEPDFEKILSSMAGLKVDDGTETPIHLQGHGVQRAVVFAMIETISRQNVRNLEQENETRSSVFLFEEPELFMHPHLMRRMRDSLLEMSLRNDFQVVITTHSPFLVNVADDPTSLAIFSRATRNSPPSVKQLNEDPFTGEEGSRERVMLRAALDFHPTVCEAFFAKRTVLVEGDTEKAILNHSGKAYQCFGIEEQTYSDTTIVSCGGKWTIAPVAKLLRLFQIPFRIIHDCDAKERTPEELAALRGIDPYCANAKIQAAAGTARILVISDTFEDIIFPAGETPAKDKPFKSWERLQSLIQDTANPLARNERIYEFFQFAFNW